MTFLNSPHASWCSLPGSIFAKATFCQSFSIVGSFSGAADQMHSCELAAVASMRGALGASLRGFMHALCHSAALKSEPTLLTGSSTVKFAITRPRWGEPGTVATQLADATAR